MSNLNKEKALDFIHTEVHAMRINPPKTVSNFEWRINKLIAELYSEDCHECKEKADRLKYVQAPEGKKGFFDGILGK